MAYRKTNLLITMVFDENSDIRKQVGTELSFKAEVIKDLQHLIQGKEIKHFVVAEDKVINEKLTADVVEREKIDKAIEEVQKEREWLSNAGYNNYNVDVAFSSIIHKLKDLGE